MIKKRLPADLGPIEEACRKAGFRLTHQRLEIFRELARSTDHPSAETLHRRLARRVPTLSLDTVYRTLATFNHCRLVQKVETADSQARFEAVHERHHHLICRCCHGIADFAWPSIDKAVLPDGARDWGRIESRNVVISGVCRTCSSSDAPDNSAEDTGSCKMSSAKRMPEDDNAKNTGRNTHKKKNPETDSID